MPSPEQLPREFLESMRATLATLHVEERRQRDRYGVRRSGAEFCEPIEFQPGRSDAECSELEARLNLRLPPDLRSWLEFCLPRRGDDFPNWRESPEQEVQTDEEWLLRGIWNDVDPRQQPYWALNDAKEWELITPEFKPRMWSPTWGPAPRDRDAAWTILSEQFERAPRLVRLYAHRFIPATPYEQGNPVFSIMQTDIIVYGNDLADYFAREFGVPRPSWAVDNPKEIPFWSELVRMNDG
jgi:hypothetical protein